MGIAMFFRPGRMKYILHGKKLYAPTLSRFGQTRYSHQSFKAASQAQEYAERWAKRAIRMIGGTNA